MRATRAPTQPTQTARSAFALLVWSGWTLASLFGGAALLCVFSAIQKQAVGVALAPRGFVVPALFGGVTGWVIGLLFRRLALRADELRTANRHRRAAEQAAKERAQHYRAVINSIRESLLVIDGDRRVIDVNDAVVAASGLDRERLVGKYCYEVTHDAAVPCEERDASCPLQQVFETGELRHCHHVQRNQDESTRHTLLSFSPQTDHQGEVVQVIEIVTDVTQLVRAQEAVRATTERLALAQEAAGLGMWDWDAATNSVAINERSAEMLGYRVEDLELSRGAWTDLVHPEDLRRLARGVVAHMKGTTPVLEVGVRLRHQAGRWLDVLTRGKVIERDAAGLPVRASGVQVDITSRKQAEQDKADLQVQLHQAQKMEAIGQLASGVAHDFNNLLAAILGHAELAMDSVGPGSPALAPLETVCDAVDRASTVARSLLLFGQATGMPRALVSPNAVLEDTAKLLRRLLPQSIDMVIDPRCCEARRILADETEVQQIVLNLALNARDAMPEGGTLRLGCRDGTAAETDVPVAQRGRTADCPVLLTVSDTGTGIPEAIRSQIFVPFFTTKVRGLGTGLGLAVVFGIVESLDGTIDVESEEGRGSTFTMVLPSVEADDAKPESAGAQAAPKGNGEHILLAEDDAPGLRAMQSYLEAQGYRLTLCEDGLQLMDAWCDLQTTVELIITDEDMPGRNGSACLRAIRDGGSTVPAIVVSGAADAQPTDAPADCILLRKPVHLADLGRQVRESLDAFHQASRS